MQPATTINEKIQRGMFDFFYRHHKTDLDRIFQTPKPVNPVTRYLVIQQSNLNFRRQENAVLEEKSLNCSLGEIENSSKAKEARKLKIHKVKKEVLNNQKATLATS